MLIVERDPRELIDRLRAFEPQHDRGPSGSTARRPERGRRRSCRATRDAHPARPVRGRRARRARELRGRRARVRGRAHSGGGRLRPGGRRAPGRRGRRRARRAPAARPGRHPRALAAARHRRHDGAGAARLARVRTLPEEARLADPDYAGALGADFVRGAGGQRHHHGARVRLPLPGGPGALLRGGRAQRPADSERPGRLGPRPAPGAAPRAGRGLRRRPRAGASWHGRGRLRYAVTPRFSLSCSERMLESCGALGARSSTARS